MGRVLGHARGPRSGPTLVAVAGLHGNETAGISALERVLGELSGREDQLSGDFVALSGNRAALGRNRRFLGRDLNRLWTQDRMNAFRRAGVGDHPAGVSPDPEDEEQRELLFALHQALAAARGEVFFLDLHTTSGPGHPFTTVADASMSRAFAQHIPVPLILGLGETLQGTLTGYMTSLGVPAMVFEGGQHGAPGSVECSEAATWLSLAATGMVPEVSFPQVGRGRETLKTAAWQLPPLLEMRYRHALTPGDGFRMLPGFRSFQPVEAGQLLAEDRDGPVRCPMPGRLLMPLYQAQGEDGFFLIREVAG
ncbi:MAG: succinylglutamate desuccinylase/aspartoacylase family protein [Longimicrobiales bacterium]